MSARMKLNPAKTAIAAALAVFGMAGTSGAWAQSAGTWLVKGGWNRIAPQVDSGDLSAPSLPGTKIDVDADSSLILTLGYMLTDHWSVEAFGGLPYEHDVQGAGAIEGVGRIGTVKQISPTVFAQYRALEANSPIRPYAGLGITYAYFYDEKGSAALTALTNPGGDATRLSVDSAWGVSAQLGVTWTPMPRWFVDAAVVKTWIDTTSHLSTGQSIDTKLDPLAINLSVGYQF